MSEINGSMDMQLNAFLRKHSAKVYKCNHCMQSITFKDRKPYNDDGSEHRCLSLRGIPCKRCGASVNFKDGLPMNIDGSPHRCIAESRQRDRMSIDLTTGELFDPNSRRDA